MSARWPRIREFLPDPLDRALVALEEAGKKAADQRWSRRDRAEAMCQACRVLLVASRGGLRPSDAGEDER